MGNDIASLSVIGVNVNVLSFSEALELVVEWGHCRHSRFVIMSNAHVLVTAVNDSNFGEICNLADLVLPDGASVAWMIRKLGARGQERVSGPDLMWGLLARSALEGMPVFFYGSTPTTLQALVIQVSLAYPTLKIAGQESPPFRELTLEEDAQTIARINSSGAGLVFVGLGCPKQEHWMMAHRGHINAVMLGVGAAFDFHAETISRAPLWMRENGLEWFHRLISEPRRLWKRYLITNTLFVLMALNQLGNKWLTNLRSN